MTPTLGRESPNARRLTWIAGLIVAAGAGVATAHGLYQVAAAARVPAAIAWLYPLITDGLALVAYAATAATARLHHGARRYAASIVVFAAGLSGLAQAVFLAGGLGRATSAPIGLRFGVGAWPAIAAALTAHLLHLIGTDPNAATAGPAERASSNPAPYNSAPSDAASNRASNPNEQSRPTERSNPLAGSGPGRHLNTEADAPERKAPAGSARERALTAARSHHDRHGALPTVTQLMQLCGVARGTAGSALKDLRADRPNLHVVTTNRENRTNQ